MSDFGKNKNKKGKISTLSIFSLLSSIIEKILQTFLEIKKWRAEEQFWSTIDKKRIRWNGSKQRTIKSQNKWAGSAVQHTFTICPYLYLNNLFLRCCSFHRFSFNAVKIDLGKFEKVNSHKQLTATLNQLKCDKPLMSLEFGKNYTSLSKKTCAKVFWERKIEFCRLLFGNIENQAARLVFGKASKETKQIFFLSSKPGKVT